MPAPAYLKTLLGPRCSDDPDRLLRYEIPERGAPGRASCVLVPDSEAEVGAVLKACNAEKGHLVISAGRTGLVEAQRPKGEAVLSLERLNRPLEFAWSDGRRFTFAPAGDADSWRDALSAWAREHAAASPCAATILCEAGMAVDAVNDLLAPLNLMFPMEMGSTSSATAGACVANGSAGANAVCYGTAAHMCEAAWGYWGSGEAAGPCTAPPWHAPHAGELAINSARFDAARGLIGSQGALGVITRVQLRLHRIPAQREAALIPVDSMPAAMDILAAARTEFGQDVEEFEFISRAAMHLVRGLKGEAFRLPFEEDPDAPFYVLLQLKSDQGADADDLAGRLYAFLAGELALPDARIGYAPLKALKEIRHSITEASNHRMKQLGGGRLSFDTATPPTRFGDYLDALEAGIRRDWPSVEVIAFGHAGVGGAHLHLIGTREAPVSAHAQALIARVFDVTAEYGGTFSAEHGVGSKWGEEFIRRTPADALAAMLAAKRAHDANNVLNPRGFGFDRLM